jgi:enterochelin esterase-like enzyme
MRHCVEQYLTVESISIHSQNLGRDVFAEFFIPTMMANTSNHNLLFINDGQDMHKIQLENILYDLYKYDEIEPVFCVAIAANEDRKMEYGVASETDYLGRGAKAGLYTNFILKELLPYVKHHYHNLKFKDISFAGFSLGGLSALDIVWHHPKIFSKVGVFSGSLWWRSKDQDDPEYNDDNHRIMQQQIRKGDFTKRQKFFFQTGALDETADRNHNGIIDAIEDTLDTIHELVQKGYHPDDIQYMELADGRHDVDTWGRCIPEFLKWGWGK